MLLRLIKPNDNAAIAQLIRDVFIEFDAPKVGTVYADASTDTLYELFNSTPQSAFYIAEESGELLGCCGVFPTEGLPTGCCELVKFYLKHTARGKGIGKLLIEKCFDEAILLGYTHIYLESIPVFAQAVNMYKRNGFKNLDGPLGNSGHTSCDVWMLKDLHA